MATKKPETLRLKAYRKKVTHLSYEQSWDPIAELLRAREEYTDLVIFQGPHHPKAEAFASLFLEIEEKLVQFRNNSSEINRQLASELVPGLAEIYKAVSVCLVPWVETLPRQKDRPPKGSRVVLRISREEASPKLLKALGGKTPSTTSEGRHSDSLAHLTTLQFVRSSLRFRNEALVTEMKDDDICKYLCRTKDQITGSDSKEWESNRPDHAKGPARTADWALGRLFGISERAVMHSRKGRYSEYRFFQTSNNKTWGVTTFVSILKNLFGIPDIQIQECLGVIESPGPTAYVEVSKSIALRHNAMISSKK